MKTLRIKQAGISLAVLTTALGLTGCGGGASTTPSSAAPSAATASPTAPAATEAPKGEKITLSFFTNNSDRAVGQGKLEQELIEAYMKNNPNITIKVETLSPDPQYQDKIKVYNASNQLPDIISAWGNTNFLKPLVNNNALAEINKADLKDMGFIPSSLDGFSFDGKLYGIPRNSDFWVLYYNKKVFADNGLQVPKTEAELFSVFDKLKAKKIVPIAMDGREAWTSGLWFDTLVQRASGTWDTSKKAMDRSGTYKDPATVEAAKAVQRWVKAGAFGDGFLNQDYGAARNMFGQGKAAMFMMGEWEMGMASDANFPEEVRNNIGAFPIPSIEGGKGSTDDLTAWFGGGYAVSNNSKHKKEAIEFLKWMFRPDGWAKGVWQNGITFPAQKYDQYLTGKETEVQKDLTKIFNNSKTYSGTVAQDKFSSDTQKTFYDSIQKLEGIKMTPEDFANAIDEAADKSAKATK
ncbi:ABC transporter substrate-binding protein [Paenibacillus sp. N3.4]|uniref:ABC transporter substrate-binding protein n=1 Tax=Paenibacillus sp. N3.4 TaxID=2603222 RepID=UPI0011C6FEDD|nr:extracellular solute-binding protein [Paenibacillus sp. N3.4]TXK77820.1 extracellular solute-binding protein [Paenibacillus sp. N3.4]